MIKFLLKWLINIIALYAVIHLVAGVSIDNTETVIIAALILGLLNAFIRPVILVVTLPFTILTLGAFTLVVNGFLFYIAAKFVKGFTVAGFWNAFWAAIVFSVISSILHFIFTPKTNLQFSFFRAGASTPPPRRKIDDDDVIDVDGKSR